jgi:hypothetical protein
MKYIIETITKNGMITSSRLPIHMRLKKPHFGDLVMLKEDPQKLGMIERTWDTGYHVCVGARSVFMGEHHISISGGPFRVIPFDKLEPTYQLGEALFWTWAIAPEGDGGVEFKISRPIFKELE